MLILYIEDEKSIGIFLKEELEDEGYDVVVAVCGVEGIRMLEEGFIFNNPFDLVILDIRLPDIDGIELLRKIKERWPKLPVIFHTAYDYYRDNFFRYGDQKHILLRAAIFRSLKKL
ncbi:MAG: response regulator [Nitrospirota bacterium]